MARTLMPGPTYPFRDRSADHLFPWGEDGSGPGVLMASQLAKADGKAVNGIGAALFFPEGRAAYERKLKRLIESFCDE